MYAENCRGGIQAYGNGNRKDRSKERRLPMVGERSSTELEMKVTRRLLLPTPQSPINKILNDRSQLLLLLLLLLSPVEAIPALLLQAENLSVSLSKRSLLLLLLLTPTCTCICVPIRIYYYCNLYVTVTNEMRVFNERERERKRWKYTTSSSTKGLKAKCKAHEPLHLPPSLPFYILLYSSICEYIERERYIYI